MRRRREAIIWSNYSLLFFFWATIRRREIDFFYFSGRLGWIERRIWITIVYSGREMDSLTMFPTRSNRGQGLVELRYDVMHIIVIILAPPGTLLAAQYIIVGWPDK